MRAKEDLRVKWVGEEKSLLRLNQREFDTYFFFRNLGYIFQGSQAGDTYKMKMSILAGGRT